MMGEDDGRPQPLDTSQLLRDATPDFGNLPQASFNGGARGVFTDQTNLTFEARNSNLLQGIRDKLAVLQKSKCDLEAKIQSFDNCENSLPSKRPLPSSASVYMRPFLHQQ